MSSTLPISGRYFVIYDVSLGRTLVSSTILMLANAPRVCSFILCVCHVFRHTQLFVIEWRGVEPAMKSKLPGSMTVTAGA